MNKIKPWLKRFEMHGNLPAALQYGTVVSASINTEEVDSQTTQTKSRKRARDGCAMTQMPEVTTNKYLYKKG